MTTNNNQLVILSVTTALTLFSTSVFSKTPQRPNVLFICIDDLRRELGCYGSMVKSPNLDQFAEQSTLFTHHYVTMPTSGASRASMLSGMYPRDAKDINNGACDFRFAGKEEGETPETMFHALRRSGYYTVGIGKISHNENGMMVKDPTVQQLPHSWDEMLFNAGRWESGLDAFFAYGDGSSRGSRDKVVKPYECADVENDTDLPDGLTAELAMEKMEELAKRADSQPFCLTVGFFKPHLPFVSPKKYWDLYNREDIDISEYDIPEGVGTLGLHTSAEFNQYKLGDEKVSPQKKASDDYARKLRHAYYACVSYTDAQVGKLLNKLEELGIAENTIIVVWGDHGWHLGDMNVWGKHTIYEPSLNSTLIIKTPDMKRGVVNDRIIETVDIYPTIMELCDVDVNYPLDGDSMVKLLKKPNDKSWDDSAYSYWGKNISVRVPGYRAIKFTAGNVKPLMLFKFDENRFETKNIADENPEIVNELSEKLKSHVFNDMYEF